MTGKRSEELKKEIRWFITNVCNSRGHWQMRNDTDSVGCKEMDEIYDMEEKAANDIIKKFKQLGYIHRSEVKLDEGKMRKIQENACLMCTLNEDGCSLHCTRIIKALATANIVEE